MAKASGGSEGVWPGYVAAIACLLQALVVVCGVIALIIATVSTVSTGKNGSKEAGDMQAYIRTLAQRDILRIKYIGDTLSLPEDAVKAFGVNAKHITMKKKQKLKIWINVSSTNVLGERQAYLRLIGIKALANKMYGDVNNIEYQIFSVRSTDFPEDILHITRLE